MYNSTTSMHPVSGLGASVTGAIVPRSSALRVDIAQLHRDLGELPSYLHRRFGVLIGRPSGANVPTECPVHRPGHATSAHCHRWPDGRWTFNCYRCGIGPVDVIDLLISMGEEPDRGAAIRSLADDLGTQGIEVRQPRCRVNQNEAPVQPLETEPDRRIESHEGDRLLAEYAASRFWSIETCKALDLHAVVRNGQARIRHPFKAGGRLYGAQDRSLNGSNPKWLTTAGSTLVPFNLDGLDNAVDHRNLVNIVEGPADAITLLDVFGLSFPVIGIPGAGNWKPSWTSAMSGLVVVIIADNDDAGEKMRERISVELGPVAQLYVPDEYGDVDEWRRGAPSSFEAEFHSRHRDSLGGMS